MAQTLRVAIIGDASSYTRALDKASGASHSFGKSLVTLGKFAALGLGAAGVGGALVTLKRGFDELQQSQQVMAQTNAALKSTGRVANVSAKQVSNLATSISELTGIDDEAVQAGENMLLTFTGIRNEVGKGNDIFNQSTKAVADFATRMNDGAVPSTEQMSKASIMLGKALNDPAKGYSKLQRAGVTFTDAQIKQIKTLEESGKHLQAQKIILGELTKEFGGSAKAAGETLPGQLEKAKNQFDELAASITARLLPTINKVLTAINEHWPEISATFNAVATAVGVAVGLIVSAVKAIIPVVQTIVAWFQENWPRISEIATETFSKIAPVVVATFNTIKAVIQGAITTVQFIWEHFGAQITAVTVAVFGYIKTTIQNVMNAIRGIINVIGGLLHGDWSRVWQGLQQIFSGFVGQITGAVKLFGTVLVSAFQAAGKLMLLAITGPVNAVVSMFRALGGKILSAVGNLGSLLTEKGTALMNGFKAGIDAAWKGILSFFTTIKSAVFNAIGKVGDLLYGAGWALLNGLKRGAEAAWGSIKGWFGDRAHELKSIVTLGLAGSPQLFTYYLGKELVVQLRKGWDEETPKMASPMIKGLNHVGQLIVAAAKKYGVDARAALAVAMGEGGIKFGVVGDSGHAFGPFQFNNAGGVATGKSAAEASAWANSAKGVADAIRMMADAGAKGKVGLDAITAIVRNFERPLDPSGSIRKAAEAYKTLGPQIASNIATGTGAVKTSVANQLSALVGLVKEFAPQIGIEHVRGIIAGLVGKTPDIVAAAKAQMEKIVAAMAAAAQARTELKDAFKALAQGALSAFDAVTDAWVPPAQKLLDKMQLEDQINAAVGAVAEAQARIDAAINTRDTLTRSEGESDADFAARIAQADADIKSATEQLGAAQRSYDELQLGLRAAAQKAAHDKQRAADREDLALDLLQLQTYLDKHPEAYAATQRKIIALMKKYHVPLFTAGQKLAQAFSDGLDDGIAAVAATARKLAAALEAIPGVGKSSGSGGGGVDPNSYGERGGGLPGGTSSGRGTAAMNITVNMPNYLGDKREAARTIRDEIVRINRDSAITA